MEHSPKMSDILGGQPLPQQQQQQCPPEDNSDGDPPPQIMKHVWPCQGVRIDFPDGTSPYIEWPWEEQVELSMLWDICIEGGILTVYTPNCLKSTTQAGGLCLNCQSIQNNQWLCNIQSCISHGIAETIPYKYLSTSRLIEVLRWKDHQINTLKLCHLNTNKKVTLLTDSNLDYK